MKIKTKTGTSLLAVTAFALTSCPSMARELADLDWIEVQDGPVSIRSVLDEKETVALLRHLQMFRAAATKLTGFAYDDDSLPLHIYVIKRPGDMATLGSPRSRNRLSFTSLRDRFIVVRKEASRELEEHLRLAYTEVINQDVFPMWLQHGLVEFLFETGQPSRYNFDSVLRLGSIDPNFRRYRSWTKIRTTVQEALDAERNIDSWTYRDYQRFGFFSGLLVRALLDRGDFRPSVQQYVKLYAEGVDTGAAFQQAFGITPKLMNKEIRALLREGKFWFHDYPATDLVAGFKPQVRACSSSEALLGLAGFMISMQRFEQAQDLLAQASAAPDLKAAHACLSARLFAADGQPASAQTHFEIALNQEVDNGMCRLDAAQFWQERAEHSEQLPERKTLLDKVREQATASIAAGEHLAAAYVLLAEADILESAYDEAIAKLEYAATHLPRSSSIRLKLADAHSRAGNPAEARRYARTLLKWSPMATSTAKEAQFIIDEAAAGQAPAPGALPINRNGQSN